MAKFMILAVVLILGVLNAAGYPAPQIPRMNAVPNCGKVSFVQAGN